MKKVMLFLVMSTLITPFVKGQDEKSDKPAQANNVHNVGAFAGASGGLGLSYRYFDQKFGIQLATTPIFASDHTYLSLGLTAMYSINRGRFTQLYGYLGNHYKYSKDEYYDYNQSTGNYDKLVEDISQINITGIGLGFEILAGQRVGFNFLFGYAFYYHSSNDWNTGFDGGIGIFYKF